MHSFYIDSPIDGAAMLPPEEARHALKVLRLRPGDAVCAMDGVRFAGCFDAAEKGNTAGTEDTAETENVAEMETTAETENTAE